AGDGTTTATIIAEAICEQGMMLDHENISNLLDVKRGIDIGTEIVIRELTNAAISVKDDNDKLKQIALVSSNNDKEITEVVFDAFKVSKNQGVANIKRSPNYKTYLTTIEGMVLPM